MFLDVSFDGQEVLLDELCSIAIFVGLGIQPSAGPSRRGGAEIQQNRAGLLLGFG